MIIQEALLILENLPRQTKPKDINVFYKEQEKRDEDVLKMVKDKEALSKYNGFVLELFENYCKAYFRAGRKKETDEKQSKNSLELVEKDFKEIKFEIEEEVEEERYDREAIFGIISLCQTELDYYDIMIYSFENHHFINPGLIWMYILGNSGIGRSTWEHIKKRFNLKQEKIFFNPKEEEDEEESL